jgi:peptidoglycan hydrolase-like protein with peptidoglycan-binding domain
MRSLRPAAPAAALSALAAGALLLGVATGAEASVRPETDLTTAAVASTTVTTAQTPFATEDEITHHSLFGPRAQVVSDAATLDQTSTVLGAARSGAASRDEAPAELGTAAVAASSSSDRILALQLRLRWTGLAKVPASGVYDAATTASVAAFQTKHELPATGRADLATVARLTAVSARGPLLDPRCTAVPVAVCVDKTQKVLRFVQDGVVTLTLDANFGPEKGEEGFGRYSRTREGAFTVYRKSANHVSSGYGTPMKWALFFDGAEAMHFSDYFRRGGYDIRSFGCVDIASADGAAWVYAHSPVGTPFIVYH